MNKRGVIEVSGGSATQKLDAGYDNYQHYQMINQLESVLEIPSFKPFRIISKFIF